MEEGREKDRLEHSLTTALVLSDLRQDMGSLPKALLLPLLRHRYFEIRQATVATLRERGNPGPLYPPVQEAQLRISLREPAVQAALADALAREQSEYVLPDLIPVVAAAAASQSIPRLKELVRHTSAYVRREAVAALGALAAREALPQVRGAVDDADVTVSTTAIYVVSQLGGVPDLPLVRRYARQGPQFRQAAAVSALASLGDRESIPFLRELLRGDSEPLAVAGAEALGRLRAIAAVPDLIAALKSEKRRFVQAADAALVALPGAEVLRLLLEQISRQKDPDPEDIRRAGRRYHQIEKELPEVRATVGGERLTALAAALTAAIPANDRRNSGGVVKPDQIRQIRQLDQWYFVWTDYGYEGHIFAVRRVGDGWENPRVISGWIA